VLQIDKTNNVSISASLLKKFYRHFDVKFRNNQMVYRSHLVRKVELNRQRKEFCERLGSIIFHRRDLIYVD